MNVLAKKLQLKPGFNALIAHAPVNYLDELAPLPENVRLSSQPADGAVYDFVQLFVHTREELSRELIPLIPHLKPTTVFWVSYPKKRSGISSDLEMTQNWDEMGKYGYEGVSAAAINPVWTALRWKPANLVKRDEACNSEIPNNQYGEYIDLEKREIRLPADLKLVVEVNPALLTFFNSLSFTNRKEYIVWILSAKQQQTRMERIKKTVEKLAAGKKNPSEK